MELITAQTAQAAVAVAWRLGVFASLMSSGARATDQSIYIYLQALLSTTSSRDMEEPVCYFLTSAWDKHKTPPPPEKTKRHALRILHHVSYTNRPIPVHPNVEPTGRLNSDFHAVGSRVASASKSELTSACFDRTVLCVQGNPAAVGVRCNVPRRHSQGFYLTNLNLETERIPTYQRKVPTYLGSSCDLHWREASIYELHSPLVDAFRGILGALP